MTIVFYSLAALTVGSALCVVLMRNVLHSALFLGLCLAGVAGLYAALGADFLFAAQILVYVGGVAVLILFVVLLSGRSQDLKMRQVNEQWLPALVVCVFSIAGLAKVFRAFVPGGSSISGMEPTTHALGNLMLKDLALPFEAISIVLLASLVGAILFSMKQE